MRSRPSYSRARAPPLTHAAATARRSYPTKGHNLTGPNSREVAWAVFFHRPYCGACRRVRPFFEALAETTNHPDKLRFGLVDCVRYRGICEREGVTAPPVVRVYRFAGESAKKREPLAVWERQLLIGTELMKWFDGARARGHIDESVAWPDEREIAAAMMEIKANGQFALQDAAVTKDAPHMADPLG